MELVIRIFSLKISSLWCLTIILVLMSLASPPLSKGDIFPFYQDLSYLFQSIHRLVSEKDILVEYIPLSDYRCIPSTVGFFFKHVKLIETLLTSCSFYISNDYSESHRTWNWYKLVT